jgi:peptidoglycan hydrolase-like protein with peptidoglycan-binding domain
MVLMPLTMFARSAGSLNEVNVLPTAKPIATTKALSGLSGKASVISAEALVKELRARLDNLTGKLADTQAELTNTQDQVETATARAVEAAEAEQAMRQAAAAAVRRGQGRWSRLVAAWRGE